MQALSGTGALRIGFEFLRRHGHGSQPPVVYLPSHTWGNHLKLVQESGIYDVRTYRYYNPSTLSLDFEGMYADLAAAPAGAIILLHTSGHNPVGFDPSVEEWQRLSGVCRERGLLPFFDNAYQGYTSGSLEDDAYSVRLFASLGMDFFCACSFAKNMGLYGERVGALHAVVSSPREAEVLVSQFQSIIRPMYSSPPSHYARVAGLILSDPLLSAQWQEELRGMAGRIQRMRTLFLEALERSGCPGEWGHLSRQRGMFGFTGVGKEEVGRLKREYSIYMLDNGRISLSGFNEGNVDYVARAFTEVLRQKQQQQQQGRTTATTPLPLPLEVSAAASHNEEKEGGREGGMMMMASSVVPECEDPAAGLGVGGSGATVVTPSPQHAAHL